MNLYVNQYIDVNDARIFTQSAWWILQYQTDLFCRAAASEQNLGYKQVLQMKEK